MTEHDPAPPIDEMYPQRNNGRRWYDGECAAEIARLNELLKEARGQRGTFRVLLHEADEILSTVDPDELLEQLRGDIARAMYEPAK